MGTQYAYIIYAAWLNHSCLICLLIAICWYMTQAHCPCTCYSRRETPSVSQDQDSQEHPLPVNKSSYTPFFQSPFSTLARSIIIVSIPVAPLVETVSLERYRHVQLGLERDNSLEATAIK